MPTHYQYVCIHCGLQERRYRNVKRCRDCHGLVKRIEPLTEQQMLAKARQLAKKAIGAWIDHDREAEINFLRQIAALEKRDDERRKQD